MLKNRHLAKSISDAGWSKFIWMIAYKELQSGGQVVYVNPRNTTQNCSRCGEQEKKTLSDRIHECPYCGLVLDRNLNASRNILKIGQESPDSFAWGEEASIQPKLAEKVSSMNQEAHSLRSG